MPVKYFIFSSTAFGRKINIGKITDLNNYNKSQFVDRMAKTKTGLGKPDIEAFINIFQDTVYHICKEGGSINLEGFMSFLPSISGTFETETAGFDKSKNSIYIIAKISNPLNEQFNLETDIVKVQATEKRPLLLEIVDLETGKINTIITVKNIITIRGENLKFDPESQEEYLEIINVNNEAETIKITKFQKITDKEIVFLCPNITFTNVYIEIGALKGTKTLRLGQSDRLEVTMPK